VESSEEREALAAEFDRHVAAEEQILEAYHRLSDQLPEGPLGLVVNHIATDEEMHHFLLGTLADWMRRPEKFQVPLADDSGCDLATLLRLSADLRKHEQQTIESCEALKARIHGREAEVFAGLLDAISLDSQKHHRLLGLVSLMVESRED